MVRRGWTRIDVPAGLDPDHQGSTSSFSASTPGYFEAQSSSHFEDSGAQAAVSSKDGPSEVEDLEVRGCMKELEQEQSDRACLKEALKNAKTEGFLESRDTSSSPPEVSLAEANAKTVRVEGSLAVLGPDDVAERRVLEDALAKVRARATVAPVGPRLDECDKYCERAAKRFEKAQEVVSEALKVQIQREEELAEGKRRLEVLRVEAAATSSAANNPRDRRAVAFAESCCPVGGRFEAEPLVDHGEDFNRDQSKIAHARGCSIEGSCASASFWVRRRRDGFGASIQDRICTDVQFDRGGRQGTSSRDRRWKRTMCIMRMWCKSVRAKYGYRDVRVGEVRPAIQVLRSG